MSLPPGAARLPAPPADMAQVLGKRPRKKGKKGGAERLTVLERMQLVGRIERGENLAGRRGARGWRLPAGSGAVVEGEGGAEGEGREDGGSRGQAKTCR